MRAMTAVIGIFLLLIGFSLASYKAINSSSENLVHQLETAETSIVNQKWDEAAQEVALTRLTWEQTKRWWTMLLDHQEIDNIDLSIRRLEQYVTTQATSLSLGELAALKLLVEHIATKDALTLENIL